MDALSAEVQSYLSRRFDEEGVPFADRPAYWKWARYYLDFCRRYEHPPRSLRSLEPFIGKLQSKGQGQVECEQAGMAVRLMLGEVKDSASKMIEGIKGAISTVEAGKSLKVREEDHEHAPISYKVVQKSGSAGRKKAHSPQTGCSWVAQYEALKGAICLRNYSKSTLRTYRHWVSKFQTFVRSKPADKLDTE